MVLNKEDKKEFDKLADQMIKFLNNKGHPHTAIIIDTTHAELVEGIASYNTELHWRD